ncbi:MAG: GerMN domain-containing protein [Acidimicrobiales bacterium]
MRVIAALFLALALSSCGIEAQSQAHVFESDEVPFGLTNTTPSPTTVHEFAPSVPTTTASVAFDVFFIRSDVLVAVTRRATVVPTAADLVASLVAGPTPEEVTTGHRSALTGPDIVTHTRVSASLVTVDLAKTFNEIPRSDRIFALGQITLTLTAGTGVALVQYTIGDAPIEVPKANGVVTRDPVNRSDYTKLLTAPTPSSNNATSTTIGPPSTTR